MLEARWLQKRFFLSWIINDFLYSFIFSHNIRTSIGWTVSFFLSFISPPLSMVASVDWQPICIVLENLSVFILYLDLWNRSYLISTLQNSQERKKQKQSNEHYRINISMSCQNNRKLTINYVELASKIYNTNYSYVKPLNTIFDILTIAPKHKSDQLDGKYWWYTFHICFFFLRLSFSLISLYSQWPKWLEPLHIFCHWNNVFSTIP